MATGPNPYLRTRIMTASPEELRLMLYEGAIRFCHQGAEALGRNACEDAHNALMRAQKIVLELSSSLQRDASPDLCDKLSALYIFIYRKLVEANVSHDLKSLEEALKLLEFEKETWELLMARLAQERRGQAATGHADTTAPQQTAISSLSRAG